MRDILELQNAWLQRLTQNRLVSYQCKWSPKTGHNQLQMLLTVKNPSFFPSEIEVEYIAFWVAKSHQSSCVQRTSYIGGWSQKFECTQVAVKEKQELQQRGLSGGRRACKARGHTYFENIIRTTTCSRAPVLTATAKSWPTLFLGGWGHQQLGGLRHKTKSTKRVSII